jgi:hypothetical protein
MSEPTPPAPRREDLAIELTGFELLSLLSLSADAPGAERSRELLRLPSVPPDSPMLTAGLSSLVVRKLAAEQDGQLLPQGNVLALTAVLTRATQWIQPSATDGTATHAAVLAKGPDGATLLEPRPYGIWLALPLSPDRPLTELAADYVRAAFDDVPGRPFTATVRSVDEHGKQDAAAVRIEADGTWQASRGEPDAMPDPQAVPPDPTFRQLTAALLQP